MSQPSPNQPTCERPTKMLKRMTVVLLALVLSLSTVWIVASGDTGTGDQTAEANINATLTLTVPGSIGPTGWSGTDGNLDIAPTAGNTQDSGDTNVESNAAYHITIKADDTETYGTGSSGHMNKYKPDSYTTSDQTGADNFLDSVLQFEHLSTTGATTSSDAGTTGLTTGDQTVVYITDSATPEGGYNTVVTFTQNVNYDDPVLTSNLVWHILITYTATQDLP